MKEIGKEKREGRVEKRLTEKDSNIILPFSPAY